MYIYIYIHIYLGGSVWPGRVNPSSFGGAQGWRSTFHNQSYVWIWRALFIRYVAGIFQQTAHMLYYTILYYTILYYTILYYTIL